MAESASGAIDWVAAIEQHSPWLRRVLRARIGNRHEGDDLLQEIALAVFKKTHVRPVEPGRVAPWLYRLAVRQAINFHRKAGRKSNAKPSPDLDVTDTNSEPLDWLLHKEQQASTRKAIEKLPPRDRDILMMKYTENWSYKKLAECLGVKEKTVEYRLMKARRRLRTLIIAEQGPEAATMAGMNTTTNRKRKSK